MSGSNSSAANSGPLYVSCHCQNHVLQIHQPPDQRGVEELMKLVRVCDCSICVKGRGIWFHLDRHGDKVKAEVQKGFGKDGVELVDYAFGRKAQVYQSCITCGTRVCIKWRPDRPERGGEMSAISMRALRDPTMRLQDYSFPLLDTSIDEPLYKHLTLPDLPGAVEYLTPRKAVYDYPTEMYAGSCHCKAIQFAVLSKPLEEVSASDCSCSLCQGNGALWIYPGRRNVYFTLPGSPSTPWAADPSLVKSYKWGTHTADFWHCKSCSCIIYWSVGSDDDPVPDKALERQTGDEEMDMAAVGGKDHYRWNRMLGLNAALLTDINRFVGDVHNTHSEGSERDAPKGMKGKEGNDKGWQEPIYSVKL